MRKYNLMITFSFLVILVSCNKDKETYYLKDISSNERSIIGAQVSNQVGTTVITNNDTVSTVELVVYGTDLSSVTPEFLVSYGATISPASGTAVDFTKNTDNSVTYTVTSASGEQKVWTVICSLFESPYAGTWKINSFKVTWDDGNGWGNSGTANVSDKLAVSSTGLDDVITFGAIVGLNSSGNVYGSYSRTAGSDGSFASYINSVSGLNWDSEFGQLPAGTGTYAINSDNTVTITITGGSSYTSKGEVSYDSSTSVMNYGLTPLAEDNSLINWNNYYGDFDNVACCASKIWYLLQKQ